MKSNATNALAAAILLASACAGARAAAPDLAAVTKSFGPPVMWVARPAKAPVIDGQLDDAAWKQATPVVLGFLNARREKPVAKTTARILADGKAIYFAVRCDEPHMDRVIAAGKARDGALWSGDTVEFFIDPGHVSKRFQYYHIIVNPAGLIYDGRGKDAKAWNAALSVKVARDKDGWTVELAVPMKDLGVAGKIPKVWGLNVNRQRPELGVVSPARGITSTAVRLKDPSKYREGEDSSWSPSYCYDSHIAERFGHAVLAAGTVEVKPPKKLFEVIYRTDFDDGKAPGWNDVKVVDDNFRGPGKCIAPTKGSGPIHFGKALKDLDDVTLVMTFKMPANGRLYYYGRARDNMQCDADRHEVWMPAAQAAKRRFPHLHDYDTHGSMMAWKSHGRIRAWPGPWKMMTGHFSEPSIGSIMSPGTDWCIMRTRVGQFRRQHGQDVVPISQNYPRGLTFATGSAFLIDDFLIFRGIDLVPPEPVTGVRAKAASGQVQVSWNRGKDNTIVSYYEVFADGKRVAQTHQLTARVKVGAEGVSVVAVDLYENRSAPSRPIKMPK